MLQGKAVASVSFMKRTKIKQRHYSLALICQQTHMYRGCYSHQRKSSSYSTYSLKHTDCSRRFCSFTPYSGPLSPFHLPYVAIHIIAVYWSVILLDVPYIAKIKFISSLTNAQSAHQISNSR